MDCKSAGIFNNMANILQVIEGQRTLFFAPLGHKLGNKNFSLLGKMLGLHSMRHKVISQNVANVNTPNYRRREFRFDSALRKAMEDGSSQAYNSVQGWVNRPNNTPVRNNGNNVDIDQEMFALGENASFYEIYSQLYQKKSQMVKAAIRGVR